MKTSDVFAENLKRLRKAKGLSQDDFAQLVGFGLRGYQKYEQGESQPTPDVLDRFVKALDCELMDLLTPKVKLLRPSAKHSPDQNLNRLAADPGAERLSRLLQGYLVSSPAMQLSALYLLTKDPTYLEQLAEIPGALPFARFLRNTP